MPETDKLVNLQFLSGLICMLVVKLFIVINFDSLKLYYNITIIICIIIFPLQMSRMFIKNNIDLLQAECDRDNSRLLTERQAKALRNILWVLFFAGIILFPLQWILFGLIAGYRRSTPEISRIYNLIRIISIIWIVLLSIFVILGIYVYLSLW